MLGKSSTKTIKINDLYTSCMWQGLGCQDRFQSLMIVVVFDD